MAKRLSTTYLYRNPRSSHFSFRMRIPCFLQGIVLRKELRHSLRTTDLLKAEYRAIVAARAVKKLFAALSRNWWWIMKEMTKEEIDYLVCRYMVDLLKYFEDYRATHPGPRNQDEYDWNLMLLDKNLDDAQKELILSDHESSGEGLDDILSNWGFEDIDRDSYTYKKLRREFLKARIQVLKVEKQRELGNYSDNLEEDVSKRLAALQPASEERVIVEPVSPALVPVQENPMLVPQQSHSSENGALLSQVILEYAGERKRGGSWKPKTEMENTTSFNLLKEVLGDIPVAEITSATMRAYKQILMKLPPNMRKSPAYRDKSIKEILDTGVTKSMNTTTINKQLDRASGLFKWAFQNGYMDRNPAEGLQIRANKRDDEYRAVFTPEDLKKIFHSPGYLDDTHKHSYRFWLPVIALYTGMRLNEMCQLRLADVYVTDDGVHVFDVKERDEETKTKTAAGDRLVPLHDVLVKDLNLAGYVEKLRSEGKTRLFPELRKTRDGYGAAATRWFSRYRTKCGIVDGSDGKKHFHSFRHTVTNLLKQSDTQEYMLKEFVGHSTKGSDTYGRYGKRYSPKVLKAQVVDRLSYDVDLSHLKKSRFVVCC